MGDMSEIKTCTLVKVQLAIDIKLARETGKVYADVTNPELLVYDAKHKHVFQGRDDSIVFERMQAVQRPQSVSATRRELHAFR